MLATDLLLAFLFFAIYGEHFALVFALSGCASSEPEIDPNLFTMEIISADSMQVYRYMDIGSAKIKPLEMEGIPHHLFSIKEL